MADLAQSSPGVAGGGGGIVTIVYILTSLSFIVGFIIGTYKYVQRQKRKWTDEGVTRERQAQAVAENTAMMKKNTEAITQLSGEFTKFAVSVRDDLNGLGNKVSGLGNRLGLLEQWKQRQNGQAG